MKTILNFLGEKNKEISFWAIVAVAVFSTYRAWNKGRELEKCISGRAVK